MPQDDHRQPLIDAHDACRRFVITAKTGAIRAHKRGPVWGTVEWIADPADEHFGEWSAYVGDHPSVNRLKYAAAEHALYAYAQGIAESFLVDLIERHPTRLDDIRHAITVHWRDDPNALGGLCTEKDLKRALRAVGISRSVREAA